MLHCSGKWLWLCMCDDLGNITRRGESRYGSLSYTLTTCYTFCSFVVPRLPPYKWLLQQKPEDERQQKVSSRERHYCQQSHIPASIVSVQSIPRRPSQLGASSLPRISFTCGGVCCDTRTIHSPSSYSFRYSRQDREI